VGVGAGGGSGVAVGSTGEGIEQAENKKIMTPKTTDNFFIILPKSGCFVCLLYTFAKF
jgi:hypothetical protein